MARRPRNAPAHRHLLLSHLIVTLGASIAAVCFGPRLPFECEFRHPQVSGTYDSTGDADVRRHGTICGELLEYSFLS